MSSLYLHIPFCRLKCPYCDFYSQVGQPSQLEEYVELLCRHLQLVFQQQSEPTALKTIFFGGGTPSLLEPAQISRILNQLRSSFGLATGAEVSLEANPGTLTAQRLAGYRQAGINRLSLGVQSLADERLRLLGRIHSAEQARTAIALARVAGFANLSLDMMFSLPGQNCQALACELADFINLQPEHLSIYGLSFEVGTEFTRRQQAGELLAVNDEESAAQYRLVHQLLQRAGYEHYEISNFARPGYRCQHNQVYWQRNSCLAVGCGAHGFHAAGFGERFYGPPDLERYRLLLLQGKDPSVSLESFDRRGAMSETLYLALRTADGLSRTAFKEKFGVAPEEAFPEAFSQLKTQLQVTDGRWRFDLDGWLLYDHFISAFL